MSHESAEVIKDSLPSLPTALPPDCPMDSHKITPICSYWQRISKEVALRLVSGTM